MVEWIKDRFDIIRKNRIYNLLSAIIYPLMLAIFSFCKVNRGLDITDSAYSLSNFRNLNELDGMWFFSTFYANLLGGIMYKLPGGSTMLGMSIYSCAIKCAIGLMFYFFFAYEVKISKFYSFTSVLMALGLCWCPTTILYNYMTYLFFGMGTILFYKGIVRESNIRLIIAGFVLGSNVFVRLPNIAESGMIVVLWAYLAMNKVKLKEALIKTLYCVGGYALSTIPALLGIVMTRGFGEYVNGIKELMAMTNEAPDYSTKGMLVQLFCSYLNGIKPVGIFFAFSALAILIYLIFYKKNKYVADILVAVIGGAAMATLYKLGVFTRTYSNYSAIYGIGKVAVILMYGLILIKLFDKDVDNRTKLLMMLAIMMSLITPIGSNNDVYSVFNNLFLMLPVTAMILGDFKPRAKCLSAVYIMLIALMVVYGLQSICFGARFVFRDGQSAPFSSYVENNSVIAHMMTTEDNAKRLTEVSDIWKEFDLADEEVLLYGDVSGLGFYLDADIAISTAWPSLASFSTAKFEEDINELRTAEKTPVVLITNVEYDKLIFNCGLRKQEILKEYLLNYNYRIIYDNDVFKVMLAE